MTVSTYTDCPVLRNDVVSLEPLERGHLEALKAAVSDGDVWDSWLALTPSPDEMADDIETRLTDGRAAFVVRERTTGEIVGETCYLHPDPANKVISIGATWYAASVQGTKVNPASKLLLLERAFEVLGVNRVEIRTHVMNRASRGAIEKLGAKLDGILRQDRIVRGGRTRDSAVYSILAHEWPMVRAGLEARL